MMSLELPQCFLFPRLLSSPPQVFSHLCSSLLLPCARRQIYTDLRGLKKKKFSDVHLNFSSFIIFDSKAVGFLLQFLSALIYIYFFLSGSPLRL